MSTGRRSLRASSARLNLMHWDMTAPEGKCLSGLYGTKKQEAFRRTGMLPWNHQLRNKLPYSPLFAFTQAPSRKPLPVGQDAAPPERVRSQKDFRPYASAKSLGAHGRQELFSCAWVIAGICSRPAHPLRAWSVEASPKTLLDGRGVEFNFQVWIVVSTPSGHTSCPTSHGW